MKVKELEKEFTKNNVQYKQIEATDKYFVYECTPKEGPVYYEIFKRKTVQVIGDIYKEKAYPGYDRLVKYPYDEAFGQWAWCCSTLNRVQKYRERITSEIQRTISVFRHFLYLAVHLYTKQMKVSKNSNNTANKANDRT